MEWRFRKVDGKMQGVLKLEKNESMQDEGMGVTLVLEEENV